MGLTDGRGRLRLPEEALAAAQPAVRGPASHHGGLDLLQVVRLSRDFGLKEADVGLISGLLLGEPQREGGRQHRREVRLSSYICFHFRRFDELTNTARTS